MPRTWPESVPRSAGTLRILPASKLRRVIPVPGPNHQVLAALYANIHGVIQAVGLERLGAIEQVVLVAQLICDVLKRLPQVLRLERKKRKPAGLLRQIPQHLV